MARGRRGGLRPTCRSVSFGWVCVCVHKRNRIGQYNIKKYINIGLKKFSKDVKLKKYPTKKHSY